MYCSLRLVMIVIVPFGVLSINSAQGGISSGDSILLTTWGSATGGMGADLIPGHGPSLLGQGNSGGEFLLTDTQAGPNSGSAFITFCVEYTEEFYPGSPYKVIVSDSAVNGSLVPPSDRYPGITHYTNPGGLPDASGTASGYTPLLPETKWLFQQYATGNMSGYYNNAGANAMQMAIWYLQGQIAGAVSPDSRPVLSSNPTAQYLVGLAALHTGFSSSAVQVAQLWSGSVTQNEQGQWVGTGNSQDQIIYNPSAGVNDPNVGAVPEPASLAVWSMTLVVGAVATLRSRRARRR